MNGWTAARVFTFRASPSGRPELKGETMPKSNRNHKVDPFCIRMVRGLAECWLCELPKTLLTMKRGRGWVARPLTAAEVDDRKLAVGSAEALRFRFKRYDECRAAGDDDRIIDAVFELACTYQRLIHHLEKAGGRRELARRGGLTRDKSDLAWQTQVEYEMERTGNSYTWTTEAIGKRSGVTGRTVRKHTHKPHQK